MIFRPTPIPGVIEILPETVRDDRGYFARVWCADEFEQNGIPVDFVQCNTSYNRSLGTLRGMHYQAAPHGEAKLVRCTRGRLFDAVADLRPGSPSRGQWWGAELSADNGRMLFIPEGVAHGFETLEDDTEIFYQMSAAYEPSAARGVRWDDPALAIDWPIPVPRVISEKDRNLPTLMADAPC